MEISNQILSEITVHMKYAKYLPEENRRETWEELVTRNMKMHQKRCQLVNLTHIQDYGHTLSISFYYCRYLMD